MRRRYVALLRGINVGGKNLIPMAALRERFEAMGFAEVTTYIASGNVLFSAKADRAEIVRTLETGLSRAFAYESRVVVVSAAELAQVVAQAPRGFGRDPARYRYDVLFVRAPVRAADLLAQVPTKPGVDEVAAGKHAVYCRRLVAKATQSRLSRIAQTPIYREITIRNWNTTTKLLALVSG